MKNVHKKNGKIYEYIKKCFNGKNELKEYRKKKLKV
jgi:hypothetical protein